MLEDLQGYPACAGIDPPCGELPGVFGGLPRMRGDRPHVVHGPAEVSMATPHARGSTYLLDVEVVSASGYPACAGIDLS